MNSLADEELSVGDYVLSGGEPAAIVLVDAVVRLLPGAIGAETGTSADSHATGLLEHPQYTRPADFRGMTVPDVLLSGNHQEVARWWRQESLRRTFERRPDMLARADLSDEERRYAIALWLADYHAHRPHRGLGGLSPDQWLRVWSATKV